MPAKGVKVRQDVRRALDQAVELGFEPLRRSSKGHLILVDPDGNRGSLCGTPSDPRSLKNDLAGMRRSQRRTAATDRPDTLVARTHQALIDHGGPMTLRELKAALGLDRVYTGLSMTLTSLIKRGLVYRLGAGLYAAGESLAARATDPVPAVGLAAPEPPAFPEAAPLAAAPEPVAPGLPRHGDIFEFVAITQRGDFILADNEGRALRAWYL